MAEGQYQLQQIQYKDSLEIAAQQVESKLAPLFMQSTYKGKAVSPVDRLDSFEMDDVTGRYQPVGRGESNFQRRWNFPKYFSKRIVLDGIDALESLKNPQSSYVENMQAARARKKDNFAVSAFFGDAKIGISGEETVTWATEGANQIVLQTAGSGATASGFNFKKLREAVKIIRQNEIPDSEQIFCALTANQIDKLYDEAVVISSEHNKEALNAISDGKVTRLLNVYFVLSERLALDGDGYTRVPVWTRKAMDWGTWDAPYLDIDRDKTLEFHPIAIYMKEACNAARIDPKRLVEIKCAV